MAVIEYEADVENPVPRADPMRGNHARIGRVMALIDRLHKPTALFPADFSDRKKGCYCWMSTGAKHFRVFSRFS